MRAAKIKAQRGYKRGYLKSGKPGYLTVNQLKQQCHVNVPDHTWVTDMTYIRTYEGCLYLAVVVDLFSRQVVGWSMHHRLEKHLVTQALLSAVWRRQPKHRAIVHSRSRHAIHQ